MTLLSQAIKKLELGILFPSLIRREVKRCWFSLVLAPLDERFGTRFCRFPRTVNFKITNLCNLRCRMCGQWGKTGFHFLLPREQLTSTLSVQDYVRIIEECAPHRPDFYIWGGEPFLYAGILDVLRAIKRRRMFVAVNTNGTRLDDYGGQLVEMGVDLLIVSIDGIQPDHDAVRGPESYAAAVNGLSAVVKARKDGRRKYPLVALACTITNANYSRLDKMLELARQLEVDHLDFGFPLFVTEKMGAAYEKRLHEEFGTSGSSWRGFVGSIQEQIDLDTLSAQMREIREAKKSPPLMFFPNLADRAELERFFRRPGFTFHRSCHAPWKHLEVQPNGDVYTCHDFPDLVVGNLREQSIRDVWRGPKMEKFRRFLRAGNLFAICGKCCRLYES
ncbi:MAG TPA: radical SAM protein [Acidobacteriota bacterium]|jgi:radical SAM protein with 4Fe4S-binding SPASM domain